MSLPVPNLDDRRFDQLVEEVQTLIPKNFPDWTDRNPSDPGITLLELLAFLTEVAIYQNNRIPERTLEHFAGLVGVTRETDEAIEQTLRRAIEALHAKFRVITAADFEQLVERVVFSCQPPLFQAHQPGEKGAILEISDDIARFSQPAAAGDRSIELQLTSHVVLEGGMVLAIDDGAADEDRREVVKISSILAQNGTVTVELAAGLRFTHAQEIKLKQVLEAISPSETLLLSAAKPDSRTLLLETAVRLSPVTVLKLGGEYLWIWEGVARAKVFIEVMPSQNVFPDDRVVNLVIVPKDPDNPASVTPSERRQAVFSFLRQRCPIATRVRVVEPDCQKE